MLPRKHPILYLARSWLTICPRYLFQVGVFRNPYVDCDGWVRPSSFWTTVKDVQVLESYALKTSPH